MHAQFSDAHDNSTQYSVCSTQRNLPTTSPPPASPSNRQRLSSRLSALLTTIAHMYIPTYCVFPHLASSSFPSRPPPLLPRPMEICTSSTLAHIVSGCRTERDVVCLSHEHSLILRSNEAHTKYHSLLVPLRPFSLTAGSPAYPPGSCQFLAAFPIRLPCFPCSPALPHARLRPRTLAGLRHAFWNTSLVSGSVHQSPFKPCCHQYILHSMCICIVTALLPLTR